jgi:hypothetical protein
VLVQVSVVRLHKARELSLGFYFFFARGRYAKRLLVGGVFLMGMIMIRCPKTGQAISTGRYVEPATFRSTPVFLAGPAVGCAASRTSGSPRTHGSAKPQAPNVKQYVRGKLRSTV